MPEPSESTTQLVDNEIGKLVDTKLEELDRLTERKAQLLAEIRYIDTKIQSIQKIIDAMSVEFPMVEKKLNEKASRRE